MYDANIEESRNGFIASKLFWICIIGTYLLGGLLLNRLGNNTGYEELKSTSLIPAIYYFFILFLSF
jgi:hypothetical protein